MQRYAWAVLTLAATGCSTVAPGHLGLMFNSMSGGLHREVLNPGLYFTGLFGRVEDFDVTFSTRTEDIATTSSEGLPLRLRVSVIYRPVVGELYDLDADIGLNYYDEVVGPEFRSAARGVFARHSYMDLLRKNEQIEDEVEADLRRRTGGKHVEVSSVTLEGIDYAPEIQRAVQEKLAAEQDALRQKTILENEDMRRRMQLQAESEQSRIRAETQVHQKTQETELAKQQAELDRIQSESAAKTRLIKARAEAEEAKMLASAKAAQNQAANQALTPLAVMMHGYDALKELGGKDTHIYLGDWSKAPSFLFPPTFQALTGGRRAEADTKP